MESNDTLKDFRIPHLFSLELVGYHDHTDELTAVFFNAYRAAIKMDEPIAIWINEYKANERRKVASMYPDGDVSDIRIEGNAKLDEAIKIWKEMLKLWEEMLKLKCGNDDDKQ